MRNCLQLVRICATFRKFRAHFGEFRNIRSRKVGLNRDRQPTEGCGGQINANSEVARSYI